jgi:deoxyribonuclease-1
LLACAFLAPIAHADPPSNPLPNFDSAKVVARDAIYAGRRLDYYCGCAYTPAGRSGGVIDATECGYTPRANAARGKRLEWEHVMPAWFFGHNRACWKTGHAQCVKGDGTRYKGRECCAKVNATFRKIEADLHNLVPSVGELNGDRSNLPYGLVTGESRVYGACNFEIGGVRKVTEPPDDIRGDVARIWFYMSQTYNVTLTAAMRAMFEQWSTADPADDWERLRNDRIEAAQGNRNPFAE